MMGATTTDIIIGLAAVVGSGGSAWAALKVGLNGTRDRVKNIEAATARIEDAVKTNTVGLARLDERHDFLAREVGEVKSRVLYLENYDG